MGHHPPDELLMRHVLQDLPAGQTATLADHLEACAQCGESVRRLTALDRLLTAAGQDHVSAEELARHSLGLVTDADAKRGIAAHLRRCSACREELGMLQALNGAGPGDGREGGPQAGEMVGGRPPRIRRLPRGPSVLAAALALLVTGCLIGVAAHRGLSRREAIERLAEFAYRTPEGIVTWTDRRGKTILTEPRPDVNFPLVCAPDPTGENLLAEAFASTRLPDARVVFLSRDLEQPYQFSLVPGGLCPWSDRPGMYPRFGAHWLWAGQLDRDSEQEIIAMGHHEKWYPSKLGIYDYRGGDLVPVGSYWTPGHMWVPMVVDDLDKDSRAEIVLGAWNNYGPSFENQPLLRTLAFFDDWQNVSGQAPPYTGREESMGSETAYLVCVTLPGYRFEESDPTSESVFTVPGRSSGGPESVWVHLGVQGRSFFLGPGGRPAETDFGASMTDYTRNYYGDLLSDYISHRFFGGLAGQVVECPRFASQREASRWFIDYMRRWRDETLRMDAFAREHWASIQTTRVARYWKSIVPEELKAVEGTVELRQRQLNTSP